MRLQVEPATAADLETARLIYGPKTGDFSSPIARKCMPLAADAPLEQYKARLEWSIAQQKQVVNKDPNLRMVKVVDADRDPQDPERLISLARWSCIIKADSKDAAAPASAAVDKAATADTAASATTAAASSPAKPPAPAHHGPDAWPEGFNGELFRAVLDALLTQKTSWIPDSSHWYLTTVVTREGARNLGAGRRLVQWGVDQARKEGLPAFLEAADGKQGWYESAGFRVVGKTEVELKGERNVSWRMRADPE